MSAIPPSHPGPAERLDNRGLPVGYIHKPEYEITPRDLRAAMNSPGQRVVLIDCRRPEEHQVARIAGSVLVPLADMERRLDEIKELAEDAGNGAIVAVHCHHGVRSLKATLMLRAHGVPAVSMAGGIDLWSVDIDRAVPRY